MVAIHSSGQTIFGFTHIEDITLCADEEVNKVDGGVSRTVWIGYMRLVTALMKDRLLGCMGQVLQQGLWQG